MSGVAGERNVYMEGNNRMLYKLPDCRSRMRYFGKANNLEVGVVNLVGLANGNEPVPDVALLQPLDGAVDTFLGHGDFLDDGLDTVPSCELEHLGVNVPCRDQRTLNLELFADDGHVREGEIAFVDGERDDGSVLLENLEVRLPVGLSRSGDHEEIDRSDTFEFGVVLGRYKLVCSQFHRFVLLILASAENDDIATHLVQKLNRQVTQSTDTNHTYSVVRGNTGIVHRTKHGGSTALQRRRMLQLQSIRNLVTEFFRDDNLSPKLA